MNRAQTSLPPAYFETMYRGSADPWNFATSPYEHAKYAHSIAALQQRHYPTALEIGCAKGELTSRLAPHCGQLLSLDVSETALHAAASRCAAFPHVRFVQMTFPSSAPHHPCDLILLSEVAYYWDDADLAQAAIWISAHLNKGGDLLLVHWTGATDYPQSGDQAVTKLQTHLGTAVHIITAERRAEYRLDLWRRAE